jgi:hypothetical protein
LNLWVKIIGHMEIEPNRITLETAINYSFEQGLTKRKLSLEELFVHSTFSQFKI